MRFAALMTVVSALFVLFTGFMASVTDDGWFQYWLLYWALLFLLNLDVLVELSWPSSGA